MSTADKRTVSTDALETLGTKIGPGEKRDAIHLAVIPMLAHVTLQPGQHVDANGYPTQPGKGIGIVDPFVLEPVLPGERFWLVIYPRMITSLRHVWTHPAFAPEEQGAPVMLPSEIWLREYASRIDVSFDALMEGAANWLRHGDQLVGGSELEGVSTSPEFWTHYSIVSGRNVPDERRRNFFSCSC